MTGALVLHDNYGLGVVLKSEIYDKSGAHILFVRWNESLAWKGEEYHYCWIDDKDTRVLKERE
jgi:hypothetical protein